MDPLLQKALTGLEKYDLLGPFAVVEALSRLERIARAAAGADLTSDELRAVAGQVMDAHWVTDGLSGSVTERRRAEVLLRLDTMLDQLQWERRAELSQSAD